MSFPDQLMWDSALDILALMIIIACDVHDEADNTYVLKTDYLLCWNATLYSGLSWQEL